MQIYQSELAVAGLPEKMENRCIAYVSPLFQSLKCSNKAVSKTISKLSLSYASDRDSDLFPTKSLLVSTNWNLNDDVFSPYEVWNARHTPSHKPTNIEHDEHNLVGHITNTWAIDNDGNIISENTIVNELPDIYHIINGAVIYKTWQDEKLIDRTEALIQSIKDGEMFVSMECLFSSFDYAIIDDCEYKIISRNKDTAWLTKHLRAYGGSGIYEHKKIGRLLRNIVFCGKGYVKNPANPESIIFDVASVGFDFSKASVISDFKQNTIFQSNGVSLNKNDNKKGESNMTELLQKQNEKLESQVLQLKEELDKANQIIANANTSQLKDKIESLEVHVKELEESLASKTSEVENHVEANESLKKELEEVKEVKASLEKEVEKVKAAELIVNRVSILVDGGIDKNVAKEKVSIFSNLSDEQFNLVANEIMAAKKMKDEEDKEKEKDKEKNKASEEEDDEDDDGGEQVVADVIVEEPKETPLSVASEDEEVEKKKSLRKQIANLIRPTKKGE